MLNVLHNLCNTLLFIKFLWLYDFLSPHCLFLLSIFKTLNHLLNVSRVLTQLKMSLLLLQQNFQLCLFNLLVALISHPTVFLLNRFVPSSAITGLLRQDAAWMTLRSTEPTFDVLKWFKTLSYLQPLPRQAISLNCLSSYCAKCLRFSNELNSLL